MSDYLSDEEQIDRFKGFLKTYGNAILTGVLVALIAFFGWSYWQKKQAVERFNIATQYQQVVDAGQRLAATPDNQAARTQYFSKADSLIKTNPDSAQALQTAFLSARIAVAKGDYATAEKQLATAANSNIKDDGLKQLAWLRLAYVQSAQNKTDAALTSLKKINDAAFIPSANEARGDILLQKNDIDGAKAAYQTAWDAMVKREEPRKLLQVKLETLGVSVPDPKIDTPIREVETPVAAQPESPVNVQSGAVQANANPVAAAPVATGQPTTSQPTGTGN